MPAQWGRAEAPENQTSWGTLQIIGWYRHQCAIEGNRTRIRHFALKRSGAAPIIDVNRTPESRVQQDPKSTVELLRAFRAGDDRARDRLIERCLPLLQRWARGRLPAYGRSLAETDDLVQVSLLRALNQLEHFDAQRPGALLSYLRTILMNAVREEIRRTKNQRIAPDLSHEPVDGGQSVLDRVIGQEQLDAYERGLGTLTERQREAVILRLEFGLSFPEIAVELETASPDAARMLVSRGLVALAEAMK